MTKKLDNFEKKMSTKDLIKQGESAIKAKQFEKALKFFGAANILDSKKSEYIT